MMTAFRFFAVGDVKYVIQDNMNLLMEEIAEFVSCVSRGLINKQEFISLKAFQVARLFAETRGVLDYDGFSERFVENHRLLCCYELMDMIFGRVVKELDSAGLDPDRKRVFGCSIQEITMGHPKDVHGDLAFVPEVVATAIRELERQNKLTEPGMRNSFVHRKITISFSYINCLGLFCKAAPEQIVNGIIQEVNSGVSLSTIIASARYNFTPYVLADLIKQFLQQLQPGIIPARVVTPLITAHDKLADELEKLTEFKRIIKEQLTTVTEICFLIALQLFY